MPKYKCDCHKKVYTISNVSIKVKNGELYSEGADCPKCGKNMKLANPKSGVANFSSNSMGQVR
tara:strand:+ start:305 stop:493 length:189 start_codon:yes stop_codon:yes gene_type:complete